MKKNRINLSIPFATILAFFLFASLAFAEDWKREISLGINKANGNTEKTEISAAALVAKTFEHSQFSTGFNIFYSDSNNVMDSQKWDGTTQYSFDFGEKYEWLNIYKLTVDHDLFANIDYRLLPSAGLGVWFARDEDWTWKVDGSLGYQLTHFRNGAKDESSLALIGHTFAKKKIFEKASLSEDLSVIPSLTGDGGTLIKSETSFTNNLTENLDLSIRLLINSNSKPSTGKKNTDSIILVGIKYSF